MGQVTLTDRLSFEKIISPTTDQPPHKNLISFSSRLPLDSRAPANSLIGTGLGLSFVRKIAHLHHHEITVENRPEGGCRAKLTLPT